MSQNDVEQILQLVGDLSHPQGFIHPNWCRTVLDVVNPLAPEAPPQKGGFLLVPRSSFLRVPVWR